jgi:predicted membrane channel-forming protein YqfA (hemolysin III family)
MSTAASVAIAGIFIIWSWIIHEMNSLRYVLYYIILAKQ